MKRYTIILAAAALLGLAACKDTKEHFTLDTYFKEFFRYKDGSQWTYVLASDTTKKETVTVAGLQDGKMVYDAFDQEFFAYDLNSDVENQIKIRAVADQHKINRMGFIYSDVTYFSIFELFYSDGAFSATSGVNDVLTYHPTYVVDGKTYSEVVEMLPYNNNYFTAVYFAKNTGIIRKDYKNGKTYYLRSYSLK